MLDKLWCLKSSLKPVSFTVCISAIFAISLQGQTVNKTRQLDLLVRLDHAKSMIQEENYREGQRIIQGVLSQLRDEQKARFSAFFPEAEVQSSTGLDEASHHTHTFDLLGDEQLDILFSAQYTVAQDDESYTVDINMVRNDPEIDEIQVVIQKPELLESLDTVSAVQIQERFTGVEEYYSEEKYHEINLVLEEKVLLNIVANGIVDRQHLLKFCDQIKLENLVRELK